MKKYVFLFAAGIALAALKPAGTEPAEWKLNRAGSSLSFSLSRVVLSKINGSVGSFSANLRSEKEDFSDAQIEFSADVNSMTTGVKKRDVEMKSPGYFNAEKFPKIIFKSTSFEKVKENLYRLAGNLTMHGITKPFSMAATKTSGSSKDKTVRFKISGKLKRLDFGIGTSLSSNLVSNEVLISGTAVFDKVEK
jgi:polyisoprenoid-binding protein YceI